MLLDYKPPRFMGTKMQDRAQLEDYLCQNGENEWQHRYAHALLRPLDLYYLWDEHEIDRLKLKTEIIIDSKNNKAKFLLTRIKFLTPNMFMYILKELIPVKSK